MTAGTTARTLQGCGSAFGTFGELLQGALPGGGQPFMVTNPLAAWSTAHISVDASRSTFSTQPAHKTKSIRVARAAMRAMGLRGGAELRISSAIPQGKGLASSSADLVAVIRAVGDAADRQLHPAAIEALLRSVEPSDGVMYDQIVDFDYRAVRLRQPLGRLPKMTIVAIDEGGEIDTKEFNKTARPHRTQDLREYADLLHEARRAIAVGDLKAMGEVSTRSAVMNSHRLERRLLDSVLRVQSEIDALGVTCAHSGTMLGLMFAADDRRHDDKVLGARRALHELPGTLSVHTTLGKDCDWFAPPKVSSVVPLTHEPVDQGRGCDGDSRLSFNRRKEP